MIAVRVPDRPDPSAWSRRVPAAALALAGAAVAAYLALVQLGRLDAAWEPLFGDGSRRVLGSPLAAALPVPDAALGAAAYLAEAVLVLAGGRERWARRPWLVLLEGLLVAAMGLGAVGLALAQALWIGAFCTLCLVSAALSLAIAALAAPEVLAAARHVRDERRRGRPTTAALAGAPPLPRARSAAARLHDQQRTNHG